MTGCFRGLGETVISIWGLEAANFERVLRRNELKETLEREIIDRQRTGSLHAL